MNDTFKLLYSTVVFVLLSKMCLKMVKVFSLLLLLTLGGTSSALETRQHIEGKKNVSHFSKLSQVKRIECRYRK